ncbi:RDD family protein [bacterium]|nr:RDD family protein [bacterium]
MSEEIMEDVTETHGKADLFKRAVAITIDSIIAMIITNLLANIIPFLGWILGGLIGGAYFLVRDGMNLEALDGQSVGKKIMKLRVTGAVEPIDYVTSIKRNITLGFVYLLYPLMIIPIAGWLILMAGAFVQLLVTIVEIYKVVTDPEGKRIGDGIAETLVVEAE